MASQIRGLAAEQSATTHDVDDIVMYRGKEAQITRVLGNDKFEIAHPMSAPSFVRTRVTVTGFQIQA